jgi:hypothetical protein
MKEPDRESLRKSLEARVGIERFLLCLWDNLAQLAGLIELSPPPLGISKRMLITEEFTETLVSGAKGLSRPDAKQMKGLERPMSARLQDGLTDTMAMQPPVPPFDRPS